MGYNLHLPGILAAKQRKAQERAADYAKRQAIRQSLIDYRKKYGIQAYIKARLSGELPIVRRRADETRKNAENKRLN